MISDAGCSGWSGGTGEGQDQGGTTRASKIASGTSLAGLVETEARANDSQSAVTRAMVWSKVQVQLASRLQLALAPGGPAFIVKEAPVLM